ncbi:MAG: hypothetical protein J6Q59_06755 [Paludibacteraceae bacterium]|nr:hypothetical protein [Paludibacteraceae bacterium]
MATAKTKEKKQKQLEKACKTREKIKKLAAEIGKVQAKVYKLTGKAENSFGEDAVKDTLKHLQKAYDSIWNFY